MPISLRGVFEPFARWYMIYLYLARMKFLFHTHSMWFL